MLLALATALALSTAGSLSDTQIAQHREAAERLHLIVEETFAETARRFRAGDPPTPSQLSPSSRRPTPATVSPPPAAP